MFCHLSPWKPEQCNYIYMIRDNSGFLFILSQRAVPMMQALLVWLLPSSEKSRTRGTEKIRMHTYVRTYRVAHTCGVGAASRETIV